MYSFWDIKNNFAFSLSSLTLLGFRFGENLKVDIVVTETIASGGSAMVFTRVKVMRQSNEAVWWVNFSWLLGANQAALPLPLLSKVERKKM